MKKMHQAILERAAAIGVPSTEVYAWPLELGSFQVVRSFVDKFAADGNGELNALIANAGLFPGDYSQTQDGWEVTYLQPLVFRIQNILRVSSHQAASELPFQCVAEHLALAILDKVFLSRFAIAFGSSVEFCTLFCSQVERLAKQHP